MWSRSFAQCVQRVLRTEAVLYGKMASQSASRHVGSSVSLKTTTVASNLGVSLKSMQARVQSSLLPAAALMAVQAQKPRFPPPAASMHSSAATSDSVDASSSTGGSPSSSGGGAGDGLIAGEDASEATLSQTRKIIEHIDPGDPDLDPATNFEEFLKLMIHPLPSTKEDQRTLYPHLVNINGNYIIDPNMTMMSTMRALHVIKAVLEQDGHIYVVNSHPLMKPLISETAHCCINPNVWFVHDKWKNGAITNEKLVNFLWQPAHQPNRARFASKGMPFKNVHANPPPALHQPKPEVDAIDKWRLWYKRRGARGDLYRSLLDQVNEWEVTNARLPVSALGPAHSQLRLVIVLDPTHNQRALREAWLRKMMTMSLVSHNAELGYVTYPIYAREFHPSYQHFFLDWLLKVVNVKPRPASAIKS